MWPWEHLAVAYLCYSACCRVAWRRPPATRGTLVVGTASVLPDLVDKPLAWWLAVLPAGKSLAHSLLVFLPLAALAVGLGARGRSQRGSLAFVVGYATHLAGDVAYPLAVRGEWRTEFLLWPLRPVAGGTERALPHVAELFAAFLAFLATPRGATYLAGEAVLLAAAVGVWLWDGAPVLSALRRPGGSAPDG